MLTIRTVSTGVSGVIGIAGSSSPYTLFSEQPVITQTTRAISMLTNIPVKFLKLVINENFLIKQ